MYIIYGSYQPEEANFSTIADFTMSQETGIRSIFNLVKCLTTLKVSGKINLLVSVCNSFVAVDGDKGLGYIYGGISGLAKTIGQENRKIQYEYG